MQHASITHLPESRIQCRLRIPFGNRGTAAGGRSHAAGVAAPLPTLGAFDVPTRRGTPLQLQ